MAGSRMQPGADMSGSPTKYVVRRGWFINQVERAKQPVPEDTRPLPPNFGPLMGQARPDLSSGRCGLAPVESRGRSGTVHADSRLELRGFAASCTNLQWLVLHFGRSGVVWLAWSQSHSHGAQTWLALSGCPRTGLESLDCMWPSASMAIQHSLLRSAYLGSC
jgi:hypothetical protein